MTIHFTKGDIIRGSKTNIDESYHPIVYFEEQDGVFFLGGMITHSKAFGNIALDDSHFEQKIDNNIKTSYFVKNYLIKKQEWAPFVKIGKLSISGIEFITENLENTTPEIWENYLTK
ncbi:hypothetical protein DR871_014330 [Flavobacterium petrolei]|uniref:Uncharacterized protein n=1 Tax=Flavobacterium petrolei TaxID=2259594 RepID=A0A482TEJ6_9FLAO|nr:hypothetical protein [Flavobacterium petrolei]RYJ51095.1 hypothetical protein DR871_014330 [Flavobacterium petrolei]